MLNGLNLYAYCGNNPVANVDDNGNAWWHWLIGAFLVVAAITISVFTAGAAAALIGVSTATASSMMFFAGLGAGMAGALNLLSQGFNTQWQQLNFGELILNSLMGGLSGAVGGTGLGKAFQITTNIIVGLSTYLGVSALNNQSVTIVGIMNAAFVGFIAGKITGNGVMISGGEVAASAFWHEFLPNSKLFAEEFMRVLIKEGLISSVKSGFWTWISGRLSNLLGWS